MCRVTVQSASYEVFGHNVDDAVSWASDVLHEWGVRSSLVRAWESAAREASRTAPCAVDLEYDRRASLLSVDVWQDGHRVFGLDDWVTPSR